jgi:hypothetical protein
MSKNEDKVHASGLRLIRGGAEAPNKPEKSDSASTKKSQHPENAFVARMNAFADALDQEIKAILEL